MTQRHFLDRTNDRMDVVRCGLEDRLATNVSVVSRVFAPSMARLFCIEAAGFQPARAPSLPLAVIRFERVNGLTVSE